MWSATPLKLALALLPLLRVAAFSYDAPSPSADLAVDSEVLSEPTHQPNLLAKGRAPYVPPPGLCVLNTGRRCIPYRQGTIVDQMSQCHTEHTMNFSAPAPRYDALSQSAQCMETQGAEQGFCVCKRGYCADEDLGCHRGTYKLVGNAFSIYTKLYGTSAPLYMDASGTVRAGVPPNAAAARWRMSITPSGLKHIFTDAHRNRILQEYEVCQSVVNSAGFTQRQCGNVAGHVSNPQADEAGWKIELHSKLANGLQTGVLELHWVFLRAAASGNILFISPLQKDARTCEDGAQNCPGEYGALRFDPPLETIPEFSFNEAHWIEDGQLAGYWATYAIAFILVIVVYFMYSSLDQKNTRYDDNQLCMICIIPLKEFAKCLGISSGYAR